MRFRCAAGGPEAEAEHQIFLCGTICPPRSFLRRHWPFPAALKESSVWTIVRLSTDFLLPVLEALLTAG